MLVFSFFAGTRLFSQIPYVLAGDVSLTNYTDIVPDYTLMAVAGQQPDESYSIDVNKDGKADFTFKSQWMVTFHTSWINARLYALDQNSVMLTPSPPYFLDTLDYNDTIANVANWSSGDGYLYYYTNNFFMGTSSFADNWSNRSKYIGLKLKNSIDSTYGWVEVSVGQASYSQPAPIVIRAFGCGYLSFPFSENMLVGPNPTEDIVYVNVPDEPTIELSLYDRMGRLVFRNVGSQKMVDMRAYNPGIYFLHVRSSNKEFTEKVIRVK